MSQQVQQHSVHRNVGSRVNLENNLRARRNVHTAYQRRQADCEGRAGGGMEPRMDYGITGIALRKRLYTSSGPTCNPRIL